MANIQPIASGELGATTRSKMNEAIDRVNRVDDVVAKVDETVSGLILAVGYDNRPADARILFTASLTGSGKEQEPIDFGQAVTNADGTALRVTSTGGDPIVVASRVDQAVEPGLVYSVRVAVRRHQNTSDPYGDAVQFGISCLNANKQKVSERIFAERALIVADGVFSMQVTFSRDQAADLTVSETTRYVRAFVRIFGGNGVTDVEVVGTGEGAGLPGPKGDTGSEPEYFLDEDAEEISWRQADGTIGPVLDIGSARKKAEAARDIAAGYASDALTGGMDPGIATFDGIAGLTFPAGVAQFRVSGDASIADGGEGLVAYSPTEPAYGPKRQSADGKWWAKQEGYRVHRAYSTAATTIYCDPIGGDDRNSGTQAAPLKTFQEAVDRVPKKLFHRYIIDLRTVPAANGQLPAIYNEDVLIQGIFAGVTKEVPVPATNLLQIAGSGATPVVNPSTDVQVGSVCVSGCVGVATPYILGMRFLRKTPFYEQAACFSGFASTEFGGQNLSFAAGVGVAGVRAYNAKAVIKQSDFTNCTNAVWVKRNAQADIADCVGTTSAAAYRTEEGAFVVLIRDTVNQGEGAQRKLVQGGGVVIDQSGNMLRPSGGSGGMYMGWPADGGAAQSPAEGVGGYSVAWGDNFRAPTAECVVFGHNAEALGGSSVAIGSGAKGGAFAHVTLLGQGASAITARRATAIGGLAKAEFENAGAFGYNAQAPAANIYKIGASASAEVDISYRIAGKQVVGSQKPAIADRSAAGAAPTQAEYNALVSTVNAILNRLREHGLIAP